MSPAPLQLLAASGHQVTLNPHKRQLKEDETVALLQDVDALVAGTEKLGADVLAKAPRLKVISRVGTGTDNVDLLAAKARGITVFNTPDAHVDAVAELVLGGTLAVLRRIATSDRAIRKGEWKKPMGSLLRKKTVGIVGLGRVGRALAELLQPFNVKLLAMDPHLDEGFCQKHGVQPASMKDIAAHSDVITLNLAFSSAAAHLLNAELIATLKPTAVIVNCARGGLIDEAALATFLRDHPEAGAYLDTFEREPYQGPLAELDNVLLSAHIGSYAREAREQMEHDAVANLLRGLAGGKGNVA